MPDIHLPTLAPALLEKLEDVLRHIQERVAIARTPGQIFALIHLVEDLSLEEWRSVAAQLDTHGWLALPLDKEDGLPLDTLHQTLEELSRQRDLDSLTGLPNRRRFTRKAEQELQRALRTGTALSLVMVDIDNFKEINDTYGHAIGDKVLVALGDLLHGSMRPYDLAARVGGEEFCLILPGAGALQARSLAVRILEDFRALRFDPPSGPDFFRTFSAGVAATGRSGPKTLEELLLQADTLLYQAKKQGKNQVCTQACVGAVSESPAMVHAAEKQFLFTGKIAQ